MMIKKLGLILVGAATLDDLFSAIIVQYELTLRFFNLEDAGRVLVRGSQKRANVYNTDGPECALNFGRSLA